VQFDEKWSFVAKKEKPCDRDNPADDPSGDYWDHVALDAESRLVLSGVPGRRLEAQTLCLAWDVAARTGGAPLDLFTSDENPAYAWALLEVYGEWMQPERQGTRGRHPKPVRVPPEDLTYATVPKTRENNRVVKGEAPGGLRHGGSSAGGPGAVGGERRSEHHVRGAAQRDGP
jgi:hypothetical protein